MKKKILILDTGNSWGGGSNMLLQLIKRLDKKKYDFTVLFYHNYRAGSSDVKTLFEDSGIEFLLLKTWEKRASVKLCKELGRALLFFSPKLRGNFIFKLDYFTRIRENASAVEKVLNERKPDLLYLNNRPGSCLEGLIAASRTGTPVVLHGRASFELSPFEARIVNQAAKRVVCVSKGVEDVYLRGGVNSSKTVVVYDGIDLTSAPRIEKGQLRKTLGIGDEALVIGTVGSLLKVKRVHLLLDAMAALKRKHENLTCLIVGDGPERKELEQRAQKLGISEAVIFTGFQNDPLSYINLMDLFVMATRSEGLPNVVLEAMLLSKPVCAFDVIGPSELVLDGKTGYLVPSGNVELLAEKISNLLTDSSERKRLGELGRQRVNKEFAMEKYVEGVDKILTDP